MNRLSDHSHLRNPLFTLKQCNWMEPLIAREGKVIGTRYCPKDVWAELRVEVRSASTFDEAARLLAALTEGRQPPPDTLTSTTETSGGFYCAAHFMRMLAINDLNEKQSRP